MHTGGLARNQIGSANGASITDGRIVLERYARGHTADARWESWSVAKSVTSMLFGAAVRDGHIATLDDEVKKYIPSFAGTSYEGGTLRHLLQMSSGVARPDAARSSRSRVTGPRLTTTS